MSEEKLQRSKELLGAAVGEEYLMMSIEKGSYFSLNSAGTRIWELLENPVSIGEVVDVLIREYDVQAEICRAEVEKFLSALRERGMLE